MGKIDIFRKMIDSVTIVEVEAYFHVFSFLVTDKGIFRQIVANIRYDKGIVALLLNIGLFILVFNLCL